MLPRITQARCTNGYTLWLRFSDGSVGTVDPSDDLVDPMFESLHDIALFAQVRFPPELHTLVWPNGADPAPEFLHSKLRAALRFAQIESSPERA